MKTWVKITLISAGVLTAGAIGYYFVKRMYRRRKVYQTSVTPRVAEEIIDLVNTT